MPDSSLEWEHHPSMLGIAVIVVAIVLVLVSFSQRVFFRTNIKHLDSTSLPPPVKTLTLGPRLIGLNRSSVETLSEAAIKNAQRSSVGVKTSSASVEHDIEEMFKDFDTCLLILE
jgi:hypothetical protein